MSSQVLPKKNASNWCLTNMSFYKPYWWWIIFHHVSYSVHISLTHIPLLSVQQQLQPKCQRKTKFLSITHKHKYKNNLLKSIENFKHHSAFYFAAPLITCISLQASLANMVAPLTYDPVAYKASMFLYLWCQRPDTSQALEMFQYLNVFMPCLNPDLLGRSVSTWADSRCRRRLTTPASLQFSICKKNPIMMWVKLFTVPSVIPLPKKRCWHNGACSQEFCFNYENVLLDGHESLCVMLCIW